MSGAVIARAAVAALLIAGAIVLTISAYRSTGELAAVWRGLAASTCVYQGVKQIVIAGAQYAIETLRDNVAAELRKRGTDG